ncbi:TetR family transcriptional regulator [Sedimentibacter sp. zth1]|uniref:TetR/AcrR family transcriptional regulator n=1 Tax=Sedimentibacter sp. zth1 TaxID=2816908 RepID=UPI001A937AC0|nr:TetR/AcrR family transcriptional regulator [Sedimentibacter sp. zth1]QSX04736.1 TetR family transcriptional regulator [Sedimentibacter sp. zth1]
MENSNKNIQKKRMMSYFISATNGIIEKEGMEAVTIRKVATKAGYNSATLYNYFDNLKHLIFFSSIRHLSDYAKELPLYLKQAKNPLDECLKIWECFSKHSYANPTVYQLIFFGGFSSKTVNNSIETYYDIFADEISEEIIDYMPMLLEDNLYERDYISLKKALSETNITEEDIRSINEMNILIYRGIMTDMKTNITNISVEDAVKKTLKYIIRTLKAYDVDISCLDVEKYN